MAAGIGSQTEFASELLAAADVAVACGTDYQLFVNESEAVVGRFCNALHRLKQQRFEDERKILESIGEKDVLVHFLFDCVRNRFLYRDKVGQAKEQLTEASSVWDKAFKGHLAKCETCRTVELRRREASNVRDIPTVPSGKYPIPHCLELLAWGAILLPLFAWLKGGDCHTHWLWILLAILLMLPLFAFIFALRYRPGRGKILPRFIAGHYSGSTNYRQLGLFWAPSHTQLLEIESEEAASTEKTLTCFSFGWWSRQPKPIDNAKISVNAAAQRSEDSISFPVVVSSDTCRWRSVHGELQETGALTGLSREVIFDGSAVRVLGTGGGNELWTKIGCWRIDFIFKLLTTLAVIGFCAFIAMLFFPPGVDLKCFSHGSLQRLPLRVVFLLDASGSIRPPGWTAEKTATGSIIEAFEDVYGGEHSGLLHLGLAQFTEKVRPVVNITSNVPLVLSTLATMQQHEGGTAFAPALELCKEELAAYKGADSNTFDVCVLITDGESDESPQQLTVPVDTALFGIYVGNTQTSADTLRSISTCGKANHSSSCHYFARASNFTELNEISRNVAENIAKGSDAASGYDNHKVTQPGYLPLLFFLVIPFLVWWVYLLYDRKPVQEAQNTSLVTPLRDPMRMRTVGMNEARGADIPMASQ